MIMKILFVFFCLAITRDSLVVEHKNILYLKSCDCYKEVANGDTLKIVYREEKSYIRWEDIVNEIKSPPKK